MPYDANGNYIPPRTMPKVESPPIMELDIPAFNHMQALQQQNDYLRYRLQRARETVVIAALVGALVGSILTALCFLFV